MTTASECATATSAGFRPLTDKRRNRSLNWQFLVALAAHAHSTSAVRAHRFPRQMPGLLFLPALIRFPGHTPIQELRCAAVGKTLMSVPVSASKAAAEISWTPGMLRIRSNDFV